ncbi:MAG: hypothetical protein IJJ69_07230 [Oscillospiraceae bacterium]|nr:hypothetical protein [Oscillospiraceae bacterium]
MKQQQQWVKDLMFYLISSIKEYNAVKEKDLDAKGLKAKGLKAKGYIYTIQAAADNYATIYWHEKEEKNINIYPAGRYGSKFKAGYYNNVLMSKKAYDLLCEFLKGKKSENELKKNLHGEHLTPMSYTIGKLNNLIDKNLTDDEIKKEIDYAFSDAKYCIITKEEQHLLDGAKQNYTTDEIETFLSEYKEIHTALPDYVESDFRELEGERKQSFGFGAIRLFIMHNHGVNFVDANGNLKSFKECIEYLEDDNYII